MGWFSKVKEFFAGLFQKEKEVVAEIVEVAAPVEDLEKKAREKLAIGLADLDEKVAEIEDECDHEYMRLKQTWVRIATGRFELHNEMICKVCKDTVVKPIG